MGTGIHGGFGNTKGSGRVSLPKNDSQLNHIFRKKEGHLEDTPENRKLLEDLANDESKYLGIDKWGNSWNAVTLPDGSQLWVRYRNGVITDGGKNKTPIPWNPETGLCNPDKPKQKKKKSKSARNAAHEVYNYYKNPFLS